MHGHRVLGGKIKRYRIKAGLTQEQLAQLVDCSDRLIRRAEASFPVRFDTLERIAVALADHGQSLVASDLVSSHLAIAKRLWKSYGQHGQNLPDCFPHFADDVQWSVAGSSKIPFAGNWQGAVQLRHCLERFYATVQRTPAGGKPMYLEAERHVTVKYTDHWQRIGKRRAGEQVWVNMHMTFHDGMIRRVEHQFDTLAAYRLFAD